jgi:hypothetical protein
MTANEQKFGERPGEPPHFLASLTGPLTYGRSPERLAGVA